MEGERDKEHSKQRGRPGRGEGLEEAALRLLVSPDTCRKPLRALKHSGHGKGGGQCDLSGGLESCPWLRGGDRTEGGTE